MYQRKLKSGLTILLSNGIYNDDNYNYHAIEATRSRGDSAIKVDNQDFRISKGDIGDIDKIYLYTQNYVLRRLSCDHTILNTVLQMKISTDASKEMPGHLNIYVN